MDLNNENIKLGERKMRILFIRSNPVNPDSRVEKEVSTLLKAGHDVTILAWDRSSNHSLYKSREVFSGYEAVIYRIGIKSSYSGGFRKNIIPLIKFQKEIYSFINKNKNNIDIIHACDFDTAFSAFFSKSKKCRFIYDVFDYYVDSFSVPTLLKNVVEKIDTYIMNKADAVIICTEERKKQLKYAHPKQLVIIHNTPMKLEKTQINRNEDIINKTIKVCYVGILSYGRNILETCWFISQNKQFELHIGGFGILEDQVREYGKKNSNIFFYGKLDYSETLKLEQECDVLIAFYDPSIPNHKFAAPNKFYEALMLGKPLIMAEGTGMSNIVKKFNIGSVVSYNNLGDAFMELSEKRNTWIDIAYIEHELYDRYFSWTVMEKRLLELYFALDK